MSDEQGNSVNQGIIKFSNNMIMGPVKKTKKEIRRTVEENLVKSLDDLQINHLSAKVRKLIRMASKRISKQLKAELKRKSKAPSPAGQNS